jgi:hypothetical protein
VDRRRGSRPGCSQPEKQNALARGVEGQFVVPFDALQAMFDSMKPEKKDKK